MSVSPERKAVSEAQLKETYTSLNQKISKKLDNSIAITEGQPGSFESIAVNHSIAFGNQTFAQGDSAITFGDNAVATGQNTLAKGVNSFAQGEGFLHEVTLNPVNSSTTEFTFSSNEDLITYGQNALVYYPTEDPDGNPVYYVSAIQTFSHEDNSLIYQIVLTNALDGVDGSSPVDVVLYLSGAIGRNSHAEGEKTLAIGENSHAEGEGTVAGSRNQHVQGAYNEIDTTGNYLEIIGNGANDRNRSNAYTLDKDGNAWFSGEVSVNVTVSEEQEDGTIAEVTRASRLVDESKYNWENLPNTPNMDNYALVSVTNDHETRVETLETTVQKLDNFVVSEEEPAEATEGIIWVKPAATTTGAVDYIVEQGISGIWMYRKWNSGIAECWGTHQSSVTMSQAWGGMYINPTPTARQNYPFAFTQRPFETVTGRTQNYACFIYAESSGNGLNTTTQTAQYNFIRSTSSTTATTAYLDYYVIGQWK